MEQGAGGGGGAHANLLGQLHFYLLPDLLALLIAADGEDVAVLQLLLAGTVPKLHGQQLLPHPTGEGPCQERAKQGVSREPCCHRACRPLFSPLR